MIRFLHKRVGQYILPRISSFRKIHFKSSSNDVFRILDSNNNVIKKNDLLQNSVSSYYSHIGLSLYNLNEMGEIIYKEKINDIGDRLEKDEAYLEVESVKSCNEMMSPVSGEIDKFNEEFIEKFANVEEVQNLSQESREEFMDKHNLYFVKVKMSETDIENFIEEIEEYEYQED